MTVKKIFKVIILLFVLSTFFSCATTLKVNLTRPAQLDLNGAQTIAVLPFQPYAYYELRDDAKGAELAIGIFFMAFDRVGPEEKRCLEYLQSRVEKGLIDSPYIELVSSNAVSAAIKNGTSNPADVYLTGEVSYFSVDDYKQKTKVKIKDADKETGSKAEYEIRIRYVRSVEMELRYKVVDSYTNKIISYESVRVSGNSSEYDDEYRLPSAYSIIEFDLDRAARKILKELQPYAYTKTIKLVKDKSKDSEFKYADKLAKDGYLKESYDAFAQLYEEKDMWEAGYNAAVIQEALGNLSQAQKFMKEVYKKHPNETVEEGLGDIKNEIRQANRLKEQTEFNDVLDADF